MNNDYDLNFNELPKTVFKDLKEGVYILQISEIIKEQNETFGTKYVMTHKIVGTNTKISFDNYKLFDKEGNPESWGQAKLRKLLEAINLTNLEQINIAILNQLAIGELFKAELIKNDKNYLNIKFAEIFPLNDPRIPLNDPNLIPNEEIPVEAATSKSEAAPKDLKKSVSKTIIKEIEDDDI